MALVSARVQVAASAAVLVASANASAPFHRTSIVIYNNGPNPIAIGPDNTVTVANGFLIPAGAALTVDKDATSPIFAICSVLQVTPADTAVWTES